MFKIRKAQLTDLTRMMVIYESARSQMVAMGNTKQWINGYPARHDIEQDVIKGISYLITDESSQPIGCFVVMPSPDPNYAKIEGGEWLDDDPYVAIHRAAASKPGLGLMDTILEWVKERYEVVRIDTHKDNAAMQHIVEKSDFIYCGIIYVANGTPRLAYQWNKN